MSVVYAISTVKGRPARKYVRRAAAANAAHRLAAATGQRAVVWQREGDRLGWSASYTVDPDGTIVFDGEKDVNRTPLPFTTEGE